MASWPKTWIEPPVGCAKPAVQWISVDLPAPFGPSRPKSSPGAMSSETPRRASTPVAYRFSKSSTSSAFTPRQSREAPSAAQGAEDGLGGVVAAHPAGAGARWGCGGADVDAGDSGCVGVERQARADHRLPRREGAGDDVAADVVGVVGGEVGGRTDVAGDDPLAQARGEAFDLVEQGIGCVAAVAVRDVGVGPDRVQIVARARGVGEVLLADEDEGSLRHAATVDFALGDDDLLKGADPMHRPGPSRCLVGPGHSTLHREVDLEGTRAVLVATVGAGDTLRQPLAGKVDDGARGEV